MKEVLEAFWFFLPAGIANATPVLANRVPLLAKWQTPMDFGLSWRGKRLLGDNKRWRGVVFGAMVGSLVALIIEYFSPGTFKQLIPTSLSPISFAALVGGLLGSGALIGDALESFIKRRIGVPPGERWFPFDQIDYIIGGLAFVWLFVPLNWALVALVFTLYFGLHLLVAYLGYKFGLKDSPI